MRRILRVVVFGLLGAVVYPAVADPNGLCFTGPPTADAGLLQRAGDQLVARLRALGCEDPSAEVVDRGGLRLVIRGAGRFAASLESGSLAIRGEHAAYAYVATPSWADRAACEWPAAPPDCEWAAPVWPRGAEPVLVGRAPRHVLKAISAESAPGARYLPIRDAVFGKGRTSASSRIALLVDGRVWESPQPWLQVYGYEPSKKGASRSEPAIPPAAAVGRYSLGVGRAVNDRVSPIEAILAHPLPVELTLDPPRPEPVRADHVAHFVPKGPLSDEEWAAAAKALGARCRLVFGLGLRCVVVLAATPPASGDGAPGPMNRYIELRMARPLHAGELISLDIVTGVVGRRLELVGLAQSPHPQRGVEGAPEAPRAVEPPEVLPGSSWVSWRRLGQSDPERQLLVHDAVRSAFKTHAPPSGMYEPTEVAGLRQTPGESGSYALLVDGEAYRVFGYHELFSQYVAKRVRVEQCIVPPGHAVPPPAWVTRMVPVPAKSVKIDPGEAIWRALVEHPLPAPLVARSR